MNDKVLSIKTNNPLTHSPDLPGSGATTHIQSLTGFCLLYKNWKNLPYE